MLNIKRMLVNLHGINIRNLGLDEQVKRKKVGKGEDDYV